MYIQENNLKSKLKFYHYIILGCILGILFTLNSTYVNNKRVVKKLNKEKGELFQKIVFGRKLEEVQSAGSQVVEEEEELVFATDEVCSRGSQELIDYYNNSGTLEDLGIKEGSIECEDRDKDYIDALISLVKGLLGGSDDDEEEEGGEGGGEGGGGEDSPDNPPPGEIPDPNFRLRNLGFEFDEKTKNNLITYGKHLLPILIFLVLSFLCILGWLICCFCNCCNCCCCCCCKKPCCKIPCFLFTFILYAGVVAVCFYGFTQTNGIFTGLANTECSIMHFFDEILFGETKKTTPKWAGIEGINDILSELSGVISNMGRSTYQTLEDGLDSIKEKQDEFEERLQNAGDMFYDNGDYMDEIYSRDYTGKGLYFSVLGEKDRFKISYKGFDYDDRCILDIIYYFGRYDSEKDEYLPNPSVLYLWNLEYSTIANEANSNLQTAKDGFKDILDENLDLINDTLADTQSKLNDLKKPFDNVYDKIETALYDFSTLIDDYGKQGIKLVFAALALLNILLAIFMFLICMCSGKLCVNCCCCRCACKFFTHILWNILALLMIITLLVGSIIALIGSIGGDMMSILSFIMSKENFQSESPVILDKLGGALQYLNCCINGDGDIAGQLNISGQIGSFDQIYIAQSKIEEAINNFSFVRDIHFAYNFASEFYEKRINYDESDIEGLGEAKILAYNPNNITKSLALSLLVEQLNKRVSELTDVNNKKERWNYEEGDKTQKCYPNTPDDPISYPEKLHPSTCKPIDRDWIENLEIDENDNTLNYDDTYQNEIKKDIKNYAQLVSDVAEMLKNLVDRNEFKQTIDNLLTSYQDYLGSFIDVLKDFNGTINSITGILEEYIGKNSNETFSFLNGKFIGKNLKIVLKYLKYSLGKDMYTVGLCLAIVGCSLIFSISSTILTIVIINVDIDKNKEIEREEQIAEFDTENEELEPRRRRKRQRSRRRSKNYKYN